MARSFPDLGEHDVRRVAGLLRVLGSVQTWLRMREEHGLDGAESGTALVIWAVKVRSGRSVPGASPNRCGDEFQDAGRGQVLLVDPHAEG